MNYLRSLFLNFLVVFFIDRVSPGIEIQNFENVPNIGADILFALVVAFLNGSVFFFLALLEITIKNVKLAIFTFIISYGAFIIIAAVPFGVRVISPWGVFFGGSIVWLVAFMTNYLEWKHYQSRP